MNRSTWTTKLVTALSLTLLLALWQIGSSALDAQIILPSVGQTFNSLVKLLRFKPFSLNIFATVVRALQSFLIIFVVGLLLGILAGYSRNFSAFLRPFLLICKATPVMAIILLAFIWFTSNTVPLFSAFLMGFPIMFVQMQQGVYQISKELSEMASIYSISKKDRLFYLIIPSLFPSLITGAKASLSMVWKVVIAAEVLTVPKYGVGSRMQLAQVSLETSEVLAWTIVAIILTALGDLVFTLFLSLFKRVAK
ncbi:MAG: ABC transporter permease subunit [Sphaerochaetaceae bacterium]|jgi:NitT/TauT family transport system permease protein